MASGRRSILLAVGGIALWFICTLVFWALQPLHDSVPVGIDQTLEKPRLVAVEVECNTLFESSARDDSPLPPLKPQPKINQPLAYPREACNRVHRQAQVLFGIDTAVVIASLGLIAWLWRRQPKSSPPAIRTDLASA